MLAELAQERHGTFHNIKRSLSAFNRSTSTQQDLSKGEKITIWKLETYSAKEKDEQQN